MKRSLEDMENIQALQVRKLLSKIPIFRRSNIPNNLLNYIMYLISMLTDRVWRADIKEGLPTGHSQTGDAGT